MIIVAALAACAGPKPKARVVAVEPSPVPGHERVTLSIDNRSGGEGEVDVRIVLRGPTTIVDSRTVDLRSHDHVDMFVDIAAPPGAYQATADAQFPD